jgi:hypothetical protein
VWALPVKRRITQFILLPPRKALQGVLAVFREAPWALPALSLANALDNRAASYS